MKYFCFVFLLSARIAFHFLIWAISCLFSSFISLIPISIETVGVFDLDSVLDLWFSGMGRVRFDFVANANVSEICRVISENTL